MTDHRKIQEDRRCGEELMLYLHIPFCVKKCKYCDFLSGPWPKEIRRDYLRALREEIRRRCGELSGRTVTSVFFGGGTPSLLDPEEIGGLIEECRAFLSFREDAEITLECNPGTTDLPRLKEYREAGVNRLSIGLQSPRDEELRLLGRIHTWKQFQETYRQSREAGYANINVDLMSALPGQKPILWKENLLSVLKLDPPPEHLSVYSLILEEGTVFSELERAGRFNGELAFPSEEEDRAMYRMTGEILREHGYEQYEISNYAKPGYACRHNCGYWKRRDYLGLGIGAASLLEEKRYQNERDMRRYLQDPLAGREEESLTEQDAMEEFMFLGLRMLEGAGRAEFQKDFGLGMDGVYGAVIRRNCRDGLLADDGKRIRLTARGLDLSNYVMAQFLLS